MGWSGTSLRMIGSGSADYLQKKIWEDIVWSYWRSRCHKPHHMAIIQSEYLWDGFKNDVDEVTIDDKPGIDITWWFYDYGPQTLMLHWFDLALAHRREKIAQAVERAGFSLVTPLPTLDTAMSRKTYSLFVDTGTDLLRVDRNPSAFEGHIEVITDLAGAHAPVNLSSLSVRDRRAVHEVVESGRCDCPLCRVLYRNA